MKKLFALALALLLALTCLVACGDSLSKEDLVGTWKGTMENEHKDLKFSFDVKIVFNEDDCYEVDIDGISLANSLEELFLDKENLLTILEISEEEYQVGLAEAGMTEEEFKEALTYMVYESFLGQEQDGEYSIDDGALKLDGEKASYTFEDGNLTISNIDEEYSSKIVLTKK